MSATTTGNNLIVFASDVFINPSSIAMSTLSVNSGSYIVWESTLTSSKLYVGTLSGTQTALAELSVSSSTINLIDMHYLPSPLSAYTNH